MTTATSARRPQFLTVLCILSFVGSFLYIGMGILNAFTSTPEYLREFQRTQDQRFVETYGPDHPLVKVQNSQTAFKKKLAEAEIPLAYTNIVVGLISLGGVWKMWKLKRIGFWFYLLAAIIGNLALLLLVGGADMWTELSQLLNVGITMLFLILYALNLKHMRA